MYSYPCGCPRICLCWIAEFDSSNIYLVLEVVVLYLLSNCGRIFKVISASFCIGRTWKCLSMWPMKSTL